jgi:hypothetical protein
LLRNRSLVSLSLSRPRLSELLRLLLLLLLFKCFFFEEVGFQKLLE